MIKIAIMGMGVVGGGVAEIIEKNYELLSKKIGGNGEKAVEIAYILDKRTFPGHPLENKVTSNIDDIINDDSISVVVETMGGIHPAFEFSIRAMESGKSVVTSNKAVVSACGVELLECAAKNGVAYLFEASVGGGIPIIRPLQNCLAANKITSIYGILNGTTNYILTEMKKSGVSFIDALEDAKLKGYAEKNPADDTSGADTCRKICILANLAYDIYITPEDIHYEGITELTSEEVELAAAAGYSIKLIGSAKKKNNRIEAFTAPALVPSTNNASAIDGVYNCVSVTGDSVGDLLFCGRGAGAMPTASAIVADVIEAIRCPVKNIDLEKSDDVIAAYEDIAGKAFLVTQKKAALTTKPAAESNGCFAYILPEAPWKEQCAIAAKENGKILRII